MTETYRGKPCKHGHIEEDGKSIRYVKGGNCIACIKEFRDTDHYKEYQAAYHQHQRLYDPDKLTQYRNTQEANGNSWKKYYEKRSAK